MINIAIDPGKSGAVAIQFLKTGVVETYKCPDTQKEMFDIIEEISRLDQCEAVLEKVHSMPGQGVKSVWTFSANYASWQMALVANRIRFGEVSPQHWMKKLGGLPSDKKARKLAIKDAMQKRYPELKVTLDNADALAILSVMF